MERIVVDLTTGEQRIVPLTPEEIAEIESRPALLPTIEQQRAARIAAYKAEADPLFFKSQRGEATTAEWEAKIEEIKARFPYPVDDES
jgi:hypothetical protein